VTNNSRNNTQRRTGAH